MQNLSCLVWNGGYPQIYSFSDSCDVWVAMSFYIIIRVIFHHFLPGLASALFLIPHLYLFLSSMFACIFSCSLQSGMEKQCGAVFHSWSISVVNVLRLDVLPPLSTLQITGHFCPTLLAVRLPSSKDICRLNLFVVQIFKRNCRKMKCWQWTILHMWEIHRLAAGWLHNNQGQSRSSGRALCITLLKMPIPLSMSLTWRTVKTSGFAHVDMWQTSVTRFVDWQKLVVDVTSVSRGHTNACIQRDIQDGPAFMKKIEHVLHILSRREAIQTRRVMPMIGIYPCRCPPFLETTVH